MRKRVIAFVLCICLSISSLPINAFALENDASKNIAEVEHSADETAAVIAGEVRTVADVLAQYKFRGPKGGHGFAAERGNNLIDRIQGNNAVVIGDSNVKNGADRLITKSDGTQILIQDKYHQTAKAGIDACFDAEGHFRYIDANGNPMQIEVPSDQYEQAVEEMAQKISEGKIPNVSDPKEAQNIVRKGSLTYEQAKNLAKAGTIESLKYDAVNGVITAGVTFGISTLLNYSIMRINGETRSDALKQASLAGVKSGCLSFCASVLAGQLAKTALVDTFVPTSEALANALGENFCRSLLKAYGARIAAEEAATQTAQSVTAQAAKLIRTQVLVNVVVTLVFTAPDAVDMFRGRISQKQFVKNFAVTAVSVVATAAGYGLGGVLGNLVVPGVGTIPGAIVGSLVFGIGGGYAANLLADYITDDDADEMYAITESQFAKFCEDYLISEEEAETICSEFSSMLTEDMFKDMYQSEDRESFIADVMRPLFEKTVAKREPITAPTGEELRASLKAELADVVFIH